MKIQVKQGQRFYLPEKIGEFITHERGVYEVPKDYEVEYVRAIRRGTITEIKESKKK